MKIVCSFLDGLTAKDSSIHGLIFSLNLVIAIYNLVQLKRSTFSTLAGRKAYVLLLLLPLFHSFVSISMMMFPKFQIQIFYVLASVLCCLNVLGLRMYIKVVKLAAGGSFEIQESLELITFSDGYIKLVKLGFCGISCCRFGSLWFLFIFLYRATLLFFLQPIFMMLDTFLKAVYTEKFLKLTYPFLALDMLVIVIALLATCKMTMILRPLSNLPRTCLKMLYVFLLIFFTQVQFSVIFTIIYAEDCDFESSVRALTFLTSVEMVFVGFLGSVSFPLADLLKIRAEVIRPPLGSLELEHIDFVF